MPNHGFPCGRLALTAIALLLLNSGPTRAADAVPEAAVRSRAALTPVPFQAVHIDDPFWTPRLETIQTQTIPDLLKMSDERIKNFAIIAGKEQGKLFLANSPDSDLYKIMEAAAYTLAWRPDPKLDKQLDEIIAKIAAAQAPNGYLNTQYMLPLTHPASPDPDHRNVKRYGYGPEQQWKGSIEEWPRGMGQFYCAGHLFDAAVAHFQATRKRNFLDVAIKAADNVCRAFPLDQPINYADHPQIGIGLIKLYEVTGDRKYLDLANHIVHHGHHARPPDLGDRESWKPIEDQRQAWGHAVRINYLYREATDLCRYLDQPQTLQALDSLWHSIVDRRIYLHGGVGGPANAEQIAEDYLLDNERCYCECCANIAHGQWNHALNLLTGDAKYADLVEIEAYNGGLSGISLEGTKYFYSNKLAVGKDSRDGQHTGVRTRYLFCCPAKLPGFVAGISRWAYACDDKGLYVNLFLGGTAEIKLPAGTVSIRQETQYPWEGLVKFTVKPPQPAEFDVCLRIPGWVRNAGPLPSELYRFADPTPAEWRVRVNGEVWMDRTLDRGYLRIHRQWRAGDTVELELPLSIRRVYADEQVEADRGRVALMRGPLVYCLEGVDHEASVLSLALPEKAEITAERRADLLGGVTVLRGQALADGQKPVPFTAVPYYSWENRGIHEMAVWLKRAAAK